MTSPSQDHPAPTFTLSRRHLLRNVGLGSLGLALGVAACSNPADPSASPATTGGGAGSPGPGGGAFTLTTYSGAYEEAVQPLVAAYEQDTGATITSEAIPFNEYLNQAIIQGRGGNLQGAVQLDIAWLHAVAQLDVLEDLTAYTDGAGYTETALPTGQVDGVQYGLPWQLASIGMIGNRQLLDDAGISDVPTTIEEFESVLEALRGHDDNLIPYGAMTAADQLKDIIPWIWTFGSDIVSADGQVTLGDAASVAAVEWYKTLHDEGMIAPELGRFDARALFPQGGMGFYDDAILARQILTADTPDFDQNMVVVPRPVLASGDEPQAMLWGSVIVVPTGEQSSAAADFASWLTSDTDATLPLFETNAVPPTTDDALASDVVTSDDYVTTWNDEVTRFARANPFWPFAEFGQMETILGEQVQRVLVNDTPAQDALDEAAEQISAIIDG